MSSHPNEDVLYDSRGTYGNHFMRRRQQGADARAANAARYAQAKAIAPVLPHHQPPTMNQTIHQLNVHLADLKDQHAAISAKTSADIANAEHAAEDAYRTLVNAMADGRDASAEQQRHGAAQEALQQARLQADVGQTRTQRLATEIKETSNAIAHATEVRRRRVIAALEAERDELERDLAGLVERNFEAVARGLQINARLHQLRGMPGVVPTVPEPFGYPVFRPITLSNPAPAPVFPALHRKDALGRIAAEVAHIGSDL